MTSDETADKPFLGIVTTSAMQLGQSIDLRYAHKAPTRRDIERMVALLRHTADTIERNLRP